MMSCLILPVTRSVKSKNALRLCFYSVSKIVNQKHVREYTLYNLKKTFNASHLFTQRSHFLCKLKDSSIQCRCFWGLEVAFNKVDEERVRLAGPDRAAAEWILKNEGSLRWTNSSKHLKNYNFLPSTDFESYKIEEIDLSATNVIGLGFEHLENLKHLRSLKLHGCRTIRDDALGHLHFVQDTLEYLDVSRCPMITEKGLQQLHCLKNLKVLVIYDLIEIKDFDKMISRLSTAMPWFKICTDDPLNQKDNSKENT